MRLSIQQRETLWFYIFTSPWILGFLVFTIGPLLASLYFSFTPTTRSSPSGIGLKPSTRSVEAIRYCGW